MSAADDFDHATTLGALLNEALGADPTGPGSNSVQDPRVLAVRAQRVTFQFVDSISHPVEATALPEGLREITEQIYTEIDRMCLRVGAMLHRARCEFPDRYDTWVETCLPFGADKARRLRMVHLACESLPAETLERLPRPMQALYAISRLPTSKIIESVDSGVIHQGLSTRATVAVVRGLSGKETARFSEADIIAGKLLARPPGTLAPDIRARLAEWLEQHPDTTPEHVPVPPARLLSDAR